MSNLNRFILYGHLGKDAVKTTVGANNITKVDLLICNNIYRNKADYVNFFNVSLWGKRAETLLPYLTKGMPVTLEARLVQHRWEKDGQKFQKLEIEVSDIQLAGINSKKDNSVATPEENWIPPSESIPEEFGMPSPDDFSIPEGIF